MQQSSQQSIRPKTGTQPLTQQMPPLQTRTDVDVAIDHVHPVHTEPVGSLSSILEEATRIAAAAWPRTPRPYQQLTINFMLNKLTQHPSRLVHGCLISHAPGLGKTLSGSEAAKQAIQEIRGTQDHPLNLNPTVHGTRLCTLIIAPPHLMKMWFDHISKQHPDDSIALCSSDTKANRLAVLQPGYDWYIINYQAFRSADYLNATKNLPIAVMICDESHNVKNPKSTQAKAVFEISKLPTVYYKFLLSATPVKKEADDLWFQLHIIDPIAFSAERHFLRSFCEADYTQYGARNVRLNQYGLQTLMYIQKRQACEKDPTKRYVPAKSWTDWSNYPASKPVRKTEPEKLACDCCAPYIFNENVERTELPLPPPPKMQRLQVNLADWLKDPKTTDSIEAVESTAQFKRRKLFTYKSEYTPPAPEYTEVKTISRGAYIMGFSYADVGQYLPEVIPATTLVPMDTKAREVYNQVKLTYRASLPNLETIDLTSAIAALHALRVITCCDAKLDALKNIIEDTCNMPLGTPADAPGDQTNPNPVHVIFCAYDITAEAVAKHLGIPTDSKHVSPYTKQPRPRYIAGHIPGDDRNEYAKQTAAMGWPIVATMQSMSEGVDVSYARFVDFFETDFTPGVMYQALSRVQRDRAIERDGAAPVPVSAQNHIVCNYILVENTIDEHVHSISQDRTRNAKDILRVELAVA